MAVAEVKGLPRYVKVIDASVQNSNPHIDFTDGQGRIGKPAITKHAVTAENYTSVIQSQNEEAQQALVKENTNLQAQLEAMAARLAALEAAQKPAEASEPTNLDDVPPATPPAGEPDKKTKGSK